MRKMLNLKEAVEYLRTKRGITVSRQTLHVLVQNNDKKCERMGGTKKKPALWLLPTSLLDEFELSKQNQEAGIQRGKTRK